MSRKSDYEAIRRRMTKSNPTDSQTPESREDIEQLKESIAMAYRYRNEDDGMTFEEAEADLDKVITAATQASNKALLSRLASKVEGDPAIWIGIDAIEAERQQLGKESNDE